MWVKIVSLLNFEEPENKITNLNSLQKLINVKLVSRKTYRRVSLHNQKDKALISRFKEISRCYWLHSYIEHIPATLHAKEQETRVNPEKRWTFAFTRVGVWFRGQNCECNLTFLFEAYPKKNTSGRYSWSCNVIRLPNDICIYLGCSRPFSPRRTSSRRLRL